MGRGEGLTRGEMKQRFLLVMGSGFGGVFVGRLGTMGMDDTKRFSVDGDRVL